MDTDADADSDPTGGKFCYVSLFGGMYGWCFGCGRVMFWVVRRGRFIRGELRRTVRCEECGVEARVAGTGELLRTWADGSFWAEYRRL